MRKTREKDWLVRKSVRKSDTSEDPTATVPLLHNGSGPIPWGAPSSQGILGKVARHNGLGIRTSLGTRANINTETNIRTS